MKRNVQKELIGIDKVLNEKRKRDRIKEFARRVEDEPITDIDPEIIIKDTGIEIKDENYLENEGSYQIFESKNIDLIFCEHKIESEMIEKFEMPPIIEIISNNLVQLKYPDSGVFLLKLYSVSNDHQLMEMVSRNLLTNYYEYDSSGFDEIFSNFCFIRELYNFTSFKHFVNKCPQCKQRSYQSINISFFYEKLTFLINFFSLKFEYFQPTLDETLKCKLLRLFCLLLKNSDSVKLVDALQKAICYLVESASTWKAVENYLINALINSGDNLEHLQKMITQIPNKSSQCLKLAQSLAYYSLLKVLKLKTDKIQVEESILGIEANAIKYLHKKFTKTHLKSIKPENVLVLLYFCCKMFEVFLTCDLQSELPFDFHSDVCDTIESMTLFVKPTVNNSQNLKENIEESKIRLYLNVFVSTFKTFAVI